MIKSILKSVLLSALLLVGYSSFAQEQDEEEEQDFNSILCDDEATYTYNLFEADKYFLEENFEMAEGYYLLCLNLNPDNPFLFYRLAAISLQRKDLIAAENYIDKCLNFNDKNVWYLYLAGSIYTLSNHLDKAESTFHKLIAIQPDEFDFYVCLSDVYIQAKNYKKALSTYDFIEKKFGIDDQITLQKKNIYLQLKNKKKAEAELVKLINAYPDEVHYKRLLADFYYQIGDIKRAIEYYKQILADNPSDGVSHLGLAGCYHSIYDIDNFFNELNYGFNSLSVESDIKVSILVDLTRDPKIINDNFDRVFNLSEILMKLYPNDCDVNAIYADFQLNKGDVYVARLALEKVLETRKDKVTVWEHVLLIDNQLLDWNSMVKHSSEAIEYFPSMPAFYFFNGLSNFQLSRYEQAKNSLEFGYKIISKSDPLQSDFLTFLGEVYYKLDDKDKAYSYFEKLLEFDPDNTMVINNYSYYLSLDKRDLEKAREMSLKTIQIEPDNSTYLDTYAWILFELKQYSEALSYIKKAVDNDGTHSGVIIEHYGDILYFNNDVNGAIEQWKRVKVIGNGSDKLDEKIASEKYIE